MCGVVWWCVVVCGVVWCGVLCGVVVCGVVVRGVVWWTTRWCVVWCGGAWCRVVVCGVVVRGGVWCRVVGVVSCATTSRVPTFVASLPLSLRNTARERRGDHRMTKGMNLIRS